MFSEFDRRIYFLFSTSLCFVPAYVVASTTPAQAACTISGSVEVCEGDLGDGLSIDASSGVPLTLQVQNLTAAIGDDGIAFTATSANGSSSGSSGAAGYELNATIALDTYGIHALDEALRVTSTAGKGHSGSNHSSVVGDSTGGSGGAGGAGGAVFVTLDNGTIEVTEGDGQAVYAGSRGGDGAGGGSGTSDVIGTGKGGKGGKGGAGGDIDIVTGGATVTIATAGDSSNGITAESIGGDGGKGGAGVGYLADGQGGNGGEGGDGGDITVNVTADISTGGEASQGIFARSYGGAGGEGGTGSGVNGDGGASQGGGAAGDLDLTFAGTITTQGDESNAIALQSVGGYSGDVGSGVGFVAYAADGQSGGGGGSVSVTISSTDSVDTTIETFGDDSDGLFVQSQGGGGGKAGTQVSVASLGGEGESGGDGGIVTVVSNGASITTHGERSRAIFASSNGGTGGDGGANYALVSIGSDSGDGGDGGDISVTNTATLSTEGDYSDALMATSIGGGGGSGHSTAGLYDVGGNGGDGGDGGDVIVSHSGGDITTKGDHADGVFLQSIGGGGGDSTSDFSVSLLTSFVTGGQGGGGGNGGDVSYDDGGDGSYTITTGAVDGETTSGDSSIGVFAQSVGGGGGRTGLALTIALSNSLSTSQLGAGGEAGAAGDGGDVTVNINGAVETKGENGIGILAQSIGKGGGVAGQVIGIAVSSGINFGANNQLGATAGDGGDGGAVSITANGAITTRGDNAEGILAQSVGGGGGSGGTTVSAGLVSFGTALGSTGGDAGDASVVSVYGSGDIATSGDESEGILAQSIGGGGGNSGTTITADVNALLAFDFSQGTDGGDGGDGGEVIVDYSGDISTTGSKSSGIVAQSIAHGGGSAGFATSLSGSAGISAAFSLGGDGGSAGSTGNVTVTSSGTIETSGWQAYGVLAQSVASGGGNGGIVASLAGGVSTSEVKLIDISGAIGGEGGQGGVAGAVDVTVSGDIYTSGGQADAIYAQSLGGAGGNGGFATTYAVNFSNPQYAPGLSAAFSIGGAGGDGGRAGVVEVENTGSLTTEGDQSYGIFAQSLGGSGGSGGGTSATTVGSAFAASISVGGGGGDSNKGSTVSVDNDGRISTSGDYASGIFGQSQGGDGGVGGQALSSALDITFKAPESAYAPVVTVAVGGAGGDGNTSDTVTVENSGDITTTGYSSLGIEAYSIGGSGGVGGSAYTFTSAASIVEGNTSLTVDATIGGGGGSGNYGNNVTIENIGDIDTGDAYSPAILAMSGGGDGGRGGTALAGVFVFSGQSEGSSIDVTTTIGGAGGDGNHAGVVSVANSGALTTAGGDSAGIYATSLGGGGGVGGSGNAFIMNRSGTAEFEDQKQITVNVSYTMGGTGGAAGHGEAVIVENHGDIITTGDDSEGIFAQSTGGGGGDGGSASSLAVMTTFLSCTIPEICEDAVNHTRANINVSVGGSGGASGDGGDVTVSNTSSIETSGDNSVGIVAQSQGGGGGTGGNGTIGTAGWLPSGVATAVDTFLELYAGFSGTVQVYQTAKVTVGGSGGASGAGGDVEINNEGAITTSGEHAHAIWAQSIGGGGGSGGAGINAEISTFSLGGDSATDGDGGAVSVVNSSTIMTSGDYSMGIFAQSVGGGGGTAGSAGSAIYQDYSTMVTVLGIPIPADPLENRQGDGDTVMVETSGSISTSGAYAHGIFAQSVGGGGGARQMSTDEEGELALGTLGGSGNGGDVTVRALGDVTVTGENAIAIFAQSAGGPWQTAGAVTVEVDGEVSATGKGGRAILVAQSNYYLVGDPTTITVNEDGWVHTGADAAETIAMFGGAPGNLVTNYGTIESTETDGASYMIRYESPVILSGYYSLTVDNYGTMNGSMKLDAAYGTIDHVMTNHDGASLGLGVDFDLSSLGTLYNNGAMSAATVGSIGTSAVTGAVNQGDTGLFWVDLSLDSAGSDETSADLVTFSRSGATLGGSVTGNFIGVNLPSSGDSGSILIASSEEGVIDVSGLSAVNSGVVTYSFEKTRDAIGINEELYLTYEVDYSAPGVDLGSGHRAFAGHFETLLGRRVNEIGLGGGDFAWIEDVANQILNADERELVNIYQGFTPDFVAFAPASTSFAANYAFTGVLYSCPATAPGADMDFAHQGECVWAQASGRYTGQDSSHGYLDYDERAFGFSGGFQQDLGDGFFAGGGLSLELASLDGALGSNGTATRLQAGGVAKYEVNNWTFGTAVTGGVGLYDLRREIITPYGSIFADSSPTTAFVTGSLSAAYEFDFGAWYVKPSVGAAASYLHQGAFDETGASVYGMHIGELDATVFSVLPAIEVGQDFTFEHGAARAFLRAGLLATTQPDTNVSVGFAANPAGDEFMLPGPSDTLNADLALGLDTQIRDNLSIRLAGQALISSEFQSVGASAKLRLGF